MKKVLVTGGAGFIGSHTVVELSNAGYEPIIIDNFSNSDEMVLNRLEQILQKKITCYKNDCNNLPLLNEILQNQDISGVIHFAAFKAVGESVEFPLKYYHNNIGSLTTILEAMKRAKCLSLVFSSSCTVYGEPDHLPVTEETPFKEAESPYGYTKQVCEKIINDVIKSDWGLKATTLRYFNPIGAHPTSLIGELPLGTPQNLIPYITQTAAKIRKELTIFGDDYNTADGTCLRDYIHVVDLAKAHVKALGWLAENNKGSFNEVFNLGTGNGNSVLETVQTFQKVNDVEVSYKMGPRRSGDVEKIYADVNKAKNVLGWQTELTLADALKDAWNWQKKL